MKSGQDAAGWRVGKPDENITITNGVMRKGHGGVVEGVNVSNIVMDGVASPFTIITLYSGSDKPTDTFPVAETPPRFRDFHFTNITARGAKTAGQITGRKEMPVEDITLTGIHILAGNGFSGTNAKAIVFTEVTITAASGLRTSCSTTT